MLFQLNVILTAILSGFMFSYALVLGNFLSYLVEKELGQAFFEAYARFRRERKVVTLYRLVMIAQTLLALLTLLLHGGTGPFFPLVLAVLDFPLLVLAHALTRYLPVEEKVNSGRRLTAEERTLYLRWNIILHLCYGLLYTGTALWLLAA